MHDTELIGSAEAAKILGIARTTLTRRIAAGVVCPASKLPSATGAYVFDRAEIDRLAESEHHA